MHILSILPYYGFLMLTNYIRQEMWVFDTALNKMVFREIKYVPGLYKIFDEILVNAADNKQRDKSMSIIKIRIDP